MTQDEHLIPFMFHYPGAVVAYGPIYAKNERDARARHRRSLGVKRLSQGYQFWKA